MMFSEELAQYDWEETATKITSMTSFDVEKALSKSHLNVSDFMALVSPAATPYLEHMAA